MARRMFSPKIVESDAFLDMPISTQALYFHLGMEADDDGFVSPRKIMRAIGATEDDLKVLISKRFVLPFENGVVVIKHWKINNLVRTDFYRPTTYIEQKERLFLKFNNAYTLDSSQGLPLVNKMLTVCSRRLGKDRIITDASRQLLSKKKDMIKYHESRHSSEDEPVIDLDTRENLSETKVKKEPKNKIALKIQKYFVEQCEKTIGTSPIQDAKGYFTVLEAMNKAGLDEKKLKSKIDEWLVSQPSENAVSITRCFSHDAINRWKVANGLK